MPVDDASDARRSLSKLIAEHVRADATGLAPLVISHVMFGFDAAADAILVAGWTLPPPGAVTAADYEAALADKRRLTRELDVAMHGEDGASQQASLCDLISPAREMRRELAALRQEVQALKAERPELDEIAAAWTAFRAGRPGPLLAPGPGFVEALSAAYAVRRARALATAPAATEGN